MSVWGEFKRRIEKDERYVGLWDDVLRFKNEWEVGWNIMGLKVVLYKDLELEILVLGF